MAKTLNILYLEDEANLEEVVTYYLEKQGITANIQRVATRDQFESVITTLDHDLVIVDRLLQDIDGIDAISLIRKYNKSIPVIMLSGTLDEALIDRALAVGANDYVLKQHIERLGPAVEKVLHHHEKHQHNNVSNANEDVFQDIVQHLPGGVYQFKRHKDGNYSLPCISTQFQNMIGINDEDVKHNATPVFEKVHPDDLPGLLESIEDSAHSLNKWDYEFRVQKTHGEYFWTKGLSTPRLQDDGSVIWAGILLDINNQKQTEKALHHSEMSIRSILDNLVETFYRTDSQGRLSMVSPSVKNLLGYSPDELLGKKLSDLYLDPQQREDFLLTLQQNQGAVTGYEAPLRHKDGRAVWVSTSSRYYYDEKGQVAGVEGITRNITDKHQQEVQTRNRLQITSERLEHLVSNLPTILYSLDIADNQFIPNWVSSNIMKVTGYSIEEALNKDWWFNHLHPDDKQSALNNMERLFENGSYTHEYRFQCKDGSYKRILDRLIQVTDDNGVPIRINGSWNDVTDQRYIEDQLRENEVRLRRSQGFANIGTWDWNIQSGELFWSERIGPLFGYEEGKLETTYDNFLAAVHPDDRQAVIDAVNNCVEHGTDYNIEHRTVWPDGTVRWLLEKGDV
ncbi:MAG: PAS domain-containing protein, partial [Thioalkalispiraceae bacterium]